MARRAPLVTAALPTLLVVGNLLRTVHESGDDLVVHVVDVAGTGPIHGWLSVSGRVEVACELWGALRYLDTDRLDGETDPDWGNRRLTTAEASAVLADAAFRDAVYRLALTQLGRAAREAA